MSAGRQQDPGNSEESKRYHCDDEILLSECSAGARLTGNQICILVLNPFHHPYLKTLLIKEVEDIKRKVIQIERIMLETLCFDFSRIQTAHIYTIKFSKMLHGKFRTKE
jgi:hypothetical protein